MLEIKYIDKDNWDKNHICIDTKSKGFKEAIENIERNNRLNKVRIAKGLKPLPLLK